MCPSWMGSNAPSPTPTSTDGETAASSSQLGDPQPAAGRLATTQQAARWVATEEGGVCSGMVSCFLWG